MINDEVILAPGEILANFWQPLPLTLPRVTRSAADGLSEAHVAEVRLLGEACGGDATTVTLAFLRAHGNPAEAEAITKWRPHVERALRERHAR